MELPWLYSFTVLADLLHFGRATAALHMNQSALLAFSVTPRDSSTISAATDSPLALAIAFCSLRALSRYVELFSTSSRRVERWSAVSSPSEVTTPVFLSAILAATPG